MPEGHTIHRLARDHGAWLGGHRVAVSSPQGRFARGAHLLDGSRFLGAEAHGKHLFHRYDGERVVHIHLGLYGTFSRHDVPPPEPRPTVRYRVVSDELALDLVGATQCELLDADEVHRVTDRLGPDPLHDDADPEAAFAALQRRRSGIGQALMDQSVLAGIGNVYRAEILHVHGVHPETPANAIDRDLWQSMWRTLVTWLRSGVEENRIITVDPAEVGVPRSRLTREQATHVYKSDRCPRCETEIRRWDIAGRWAYACETCQPRPPRTGAASPGRTPAARRGAS
ncbi:Fpg/Nei family DNA glycosylase [Egicoccus halophilus]|uniref:DNA-(apurinic or apyrimidinic site) lyase n=1 Tax=Egicoccus halophilus TaxID=1670830 RepID=A0A8J3EXH7_9ACTN|nr:DNA-formamidopyrimidine glycosylase family protein [Egicoccus halophilus]GGI05774.1 endonuclease VIII [Egicoccus halophilus]